MKKNKFCVIVMESWTDEVAYMMEKRVASEMCNVDERGTDRHW